MTPVHDEHCGPSSKKEDCDNSNEEHCEPSSKKEDCDNSNVAKQCRVIEEKHMSKKLPRVQVSYLFPPELALPRLLISTPSIQKYKVYKFFPKSNFLIFRQLYRKDINI
jgi:hypothetical protein